MSTPPRWSKQSLLLCLVLLVPRPGLGAQQEEPEDPAPDTSGVSTTAPGLPGTDEQAPRWLMREPPSSAPRRVSLGVRLLAEAGGGLLLAVPSTLTGLVGGWALCAADILKIKETHRIFDCVSTPLFGAMLTLPIGFSLGVWGAGEAVGGDGKLLATFAGMGVGLLTVPALLALSPVFAPLAIVLAVSGPLVGYELSQRPWPSPGPAPSRTSSVRPRVQPMLAFTSGGAMLGLGGTF